MVALIEIMVRLGLMIEAGIGIAACIGFITGREIATGRTAGRIATGITATREIAPRIAAA
jgi:hypothetical protein